MKTLILFAAFLANICTAQNQLVQAVAEQQAPPKSAGGVNNMLATYTAALSSSSGPFTLGTRFTVGATNITVIFLKRWAATGNSQVHTLGLWDSSGTLLQTCTVNTAGVSGQWQSNSIPATTLSSGQFYTVGALEPGGSESWINNSSNGGSYTTSGAATIVGVYFISGASLTYPSGLVSANVVYGYDIVYQ